MRYIAVILFVLFCRPVRAQTCTGGLGDPIVSITFGKGSQPGSALGAGVTNLLWEYGGCPADGQYAIVNSTSDCWGGTWVTITQDHTGDAGGYFMLINASFQPSDFFVQKVDGLCQGTTYQFAAWLMNLAFYQGQIRPNITFQIEKTDGTILQSYSTGDMAAPGDSKWIQYPFYFNTPTGVSSVVIRMINNAPGGVGNDLALDDITFRAAGPAITPSVIGFASDTIALCSNDLQTLHISANVESCFASPVYQWQTSTDGGSSWNNIAGATGLSYDRSPTAPGIYLYRLTVAEAVNAGVASCSVASQPVEVNVIKIPDPAITINAAVPYLCVGSTAVFTATAVDGGPGASYQWMLNGAPVGTDDPVYSTASLVSTDIVSCVLTSNAACVINPTAYSNTVSVPLIPIPVTGVDIAASATAICQDSVVSFTATPKNGGVSPSFVWMVNGAAAAGQTGPVFTTGALQDGDAVSCTMTGGLTCSPPVNAPEVIAMTVYPLPTIQLVPDTIIAGGSGIRLSPVLSGDIVYFQWSPLEGLNDVMIAAPFATPVSTTTYQLKVVTADGCRATGAEKVEVYYDVQMPGAFTPNGDGHNDVFRVPPSIPVTVHRLAVYNRQGGMVFSTGNVGTGWDGSVNGKAQPAGVYIWMIEYDNPLTRKVEMKKGTVVLVR